MQLIVGTHFREEEFFLYPIHFFETLLSEDRRRRKSSQLIAGTPFRKEEENLFLENLPPQKRIRKLFSFSFFLKNESRNFLLVPPLDPPPPIKYKNILFFIYSTKKRRKNILKLFFYSQAKNCRLLTSNDLEESFLVHPLDHPTHPKKIKIFSSLSILPKRER